MGSIEEQNLKTERKEKRIWNSAVNHTETTEKQGMWHFAMDAGGECVVFGVCLHATIKHIVETHSITQDGELLPIWGQN